MEKKFLVWAAAILLLGMVAWPMAHLSRAQDAVDNSAGSGSADAGTAPASDANSPSAPDANANDGASSDNSASLTFSAAVEAGQAQDQSDPQAQAAQDQVTVDENTQAAESNGVQPIVPVDLGTDLTVPDPFPVTPQDNFAPTDSGLPNPSGDSSSVDANSNPASAPAGDQSAPAGDSGSSASSPSQDQSGSSGPIDSSGQ